MQKIKKIVILIICILLINSLFINCYAETVKVTKENLNEALQKFTSSEANESNYEIKVSDDDITVTVDKDNYKINYDLTDKPKFTFEILVEKGMSYKDFKSQSDNSILPLIGYIAIANIQGVEFEDASSYVFMSILGNAFSGGTFNKNSYIIIDDTNMGDGVTVDKDKSNPNTIYASEFGERVMEYVNAAYKEKQTIADTKDGINSYEWTTERKDVTENSCKLVSTLTVNTDADFSKIKEYNNQGNSLNKDITQDNADYKVTLKVGQKCRFESTEKITGHEKYGSSCNINKINDNCIEITGEKVGNSNGYIYVGQTKKTFYVTVEENIGNKDLDAITVKLDSKSQEKEPEEENKPTQQQTQQTQNQQQSAEQTQNKKPVDNTVTKEKVLPNTGKNGNLIVILIISTLLIIFGVKLLKYKED